MVYHIHDICENISQQVHIVSCVMTYPLFHFYIKRDQSHFHASPANKQHDPRGQPHAAQ